ncbi:MAG TPA: histidine kinase dimerization/phospho-acceptor domain-containing protein [Nitrospiraceae bacterium]|nr:histidine kinase dimerization/phospho-acceptor domain-containing protein [Nitrospiraceae bacterium]
MTPAKYRILVIDDNLSIHDDFRKLLAPAEQASSSLNEMRSSLFGGAPPVAGNDGVLFEVDTADQGKSGLSMVLQAKQQQRPYAVAFVDMRMPPGWDGLETIGYLWTADPDLQVVICSAYSDHPWDDIISRLGKSDNLLILQKPFNGIEAWQLAMALSRKWSLGIQVAQKLDAMSQLIMQRTADLEAAKQELEKLKVKPRQKEQGSSGGEARLLAADAQIEFLAVLGHEIHDPLTSIMTAIHQLAQSGLTADQQRAVSAAQKAVGIAQTMIDELLQLAPVELAKDSPSAGPPTGRARL